MIRATARARAVAASTHTPIHIMKDGEIVEIFPTKEVRYSASGGFQQESELSVVRENSPPYGSQKLCVRDESCISQSRGRVPENSHEERFEGISEHSMMIVDLHD